MLAYLGRLLARDPGHPPLVRYLSKAEGDAVWRDGRLVSIDPQGACFASERAGFASVECLPWGSIGGIQLKAAEPENG